MSPQSKQPSNRNGISSEQAHRAVGAQTPHVRRPYPRRFSLTHGGRKQRARYRYLLTRDHRPILAHLIAHRRRFTTGHKHKQPYQG
ncbi:MAG: hypothetical protein JXJ20_13530 [Anaerolineae bacterium]|nr:hypothetical protein [Anaerolineae bacterium]